MPKETPSKVFSMIFGKLLKTRYNFKAPYTIRIAYDQSKSTIQYGTKQ